MSGLDEMVEGYFDGRDPNAPSPSANRSHSYRHGFANARDDHASAPRASAAVLRDESQRAIDADRAVEILPHQRAERGEA